MSAPPTPPVRPRKKKSGGPFSESEGEASPVAVLIVAPRLTGASQGHDRHCRRDIQMSCNPKPPTRVDTKNISCASDERLAVAARPLVLITGPRFTGSDHSEPAKRSAWI